jgi:hypothetical protein
VSWKNQEVWPYLLCSFGIATGKKYTCKEN